MREVALVLAALYLIWDKGWKRTFKNKILHCDKILLCSFVLGDS